MNNKETFEEFWYRYEWLNRGKNHKESALLAFNEVIKPFLDESERLKVFEDRYGAEYEIVKRIWEIIGFDEYNSKGCPRKSIFEYIEGYKAEIERLKESFKTVNDLLNASRQENADQRKLITDLRLRQHEQ